MSPISTAKHEHLACPRCNRHFECRVGSINLCQCQLLTLTEAQQQYIRADYDSCLCADCLLALQTEYNQLTESETPATLLHGHQRDAFHN